MWAICQQLDRGLSRPLRLLWLGEAHSADTSQRKTIRPVDKLDLYSHTPPA